MKSLTIHSALLASFGAFMFMGMAASTVRAAAKCMIDEGNGRYTPCEALYKSKKCMIDEGNGRYTPCEALYKSKRCMIDEGNGRYTPCEALVKQLRTEKKR
jgi:hypothetical protein